MPLWAIAVFLVYQLDEGAQRLLYVARDRSEASLNGFFDILTESTISGIQFACTDMLPAYLMREALEQDNRSKNSGRLRLRHGPASFFKRGAVAPTAQRIEPMQKLAKILLKHEPLLLNRFESRGLSSGVVEGFNNKAKLAMRKAYGFKELETIQIALFHQLGKLPEPKSTHKFCRRG